MILFLGTVVVVWYTIFRCICVGTTVGYQLISLASVDTQLDILFDSLNKGDKFFCELKL